MIHLMACAWAYLGLNWYGTEGITLAWEKSWLEAYDFTGVSQTRLYIISLYVAVVAMFGGVGSLAPANYAEYVLYTAMMIFGSMVWAWVIGSLCGILATLNPHKTAFQNTMDELEYFMGEHGFPQRHRVRLRDFFQNTQEYSRISSYNALMVKMSVQLRGDTALQIGIKELSRVWYFSLDSVEKEFLAVVALNLHSHIFEAREVLPQVDLTVITKGMAARKLRIFSTGTVLGTDCVIPDERIGLRDLDSANCLTFLQTSQISRSGLFTIVEHFPVAKVHLRKAAAIYTLRQAFKQYYRLWKQDSATSFVKGSSVLGQSFCGRSKTRIDMMRRRQASAHFGQILESIEKARDGRGDERAHSFNNNAGRFLKMRRISPGVGLGAAFGTDLMAGDEDELLGLSQEIQLLKKGQETEAKRLQTLLARNEALELRCGVLDDKLELVVSLLTSMKAADGAAANGSQSFKGANGVDESMKQASGNGNDCAAASPAAVIKPDGKVLHRRRKASAQPKLAGAIGANLAMQRLNRACKEGQNKGQRSAPPPLSSAEKGGGGILGMLNAMASDERQQQTSQGAKAFAVERQELRSALEA